MNPDLNFQVYVRSVMLRVFLGSLWLALLIFISDTSTYHIRGVTSTNFDIAFMLTPLGMIHNLAPGSTSWLRPFYSASADRFGLVDDVTLRWSIACIVLISAIGLWIFFRPPRAESAGRS